MDRITQFWLCTLSIFCMILVIQTGAASTPPVPTTPSPAAVCESRNESCETCVSAPKAKCYYCSTDKSCRLYPAKDIFPKDCDLSQARWGTCWLNFEALIITLSVIGGLLLIGVPCTIYCCCCRSSGNRAKWAREDAADERKKEERKMKHEQKKNERKAKNDEIRRKYGLLKNEDESDSLYAEDV